MNEPTKDPNDTSDAQAGEPTIDVELRNMPAMALNTGGATSTEGLVGVIRGWIADQRQTNQDVRAAFLGERLAELPGADGPTNQAEREDLGRRLWAKTEENQLQLRPPGAMAGVRPAVILNDASPGSVLLVYKQGRPSVAAEIDAKVATGADALVCAEMARLLKDAAERAARLQTQYPDGLLFGALLDQKKAPPWLNELLARVVAKNLTMVEVEDLPSGWVDHALAYRVHLALVWPDVLREWQQGVENLRKAQAELLRLHRESATAFATEQTRALNPTKAEVELLAGLLADRDLRESKGDKEELRAAAASNLLVREALDAYEKWNAELTTAAKSGDRAKVQEVARRQNDLTWRMGFAFHWPEVLRGWLTTNAERLAARAALFSAANQEKNPDALAAEPMAEGRLEQAVRELMPSATKAVRVPPGEDLEALGARNSMFTLDAALADFIGGLPHVGSKEAATDWREKWLADWSQARTPGEPACWERWADPLRIPRVLARVLWTLKVRPQLARDTERERGVVRVGTELSKTFALARVWGGRAVEEQGQQAILVEPPKGIALMLPFDDGLQVTQGSGRVGLRQVLTPRALRTYLATLVVYQDQGMNQDGSFGVEGPAAILDVTGEKKHEDRKGGRTYQRFTSKALRLVTEELRLFQSIRVRSVGNLEAAVGDPLLDEIKDRRSGKTAFYAHSRLVVGQLHNDYFRIPRAVCRLLTPDIPSAMGIAQIARDGMLRHMKSGKPIEAPIGAWLEAAGIDAKDGARKIGREFWPGAAGDLARIAEEGKLGQLTQVGQGRDLVLTLTPEKGLRESYAPLLEAANNHAKAKRAARVADQRKPRKPHRA